MMTTERDQNLGLRAGARALLFAAALGAAGAAPALADPQETAAWRMAVREGGVADYRDFLSRYPSGDFAAFARNRITATEGGPLAGPVSTPLPKPGDTTPAQTEAAIALGEAERMAVRDGLAARAYVAGEARGDFGETTRAAISHWQTSRGDAPTGYLTAAQYDELTSAPYSGAIPEGAPMTERLEPADPAARRMREEALGYGPAELAEIEARLARAGFAPGAEDGVLDEAARDAIRAFRQSRGFAAHGWLDRPMIDTLMRETAAWRGPVAARP